MKTQSDKKSGGTGEKLPKKDLIMKAFDQMDGQPVPDKTFNEQAKKIDDELVSQKNNHDPDMTLTYIIISQTDMIGIMGVNIVEIL